MSKRTALVRRTSAGAALVRSSEATEAQTAAESNNGAEAVADVNLPRDHPKWVRDRFIVSSATQAWLPRVKPIAIRLFGFWDHRSHRLDIESGTILIDESGATALHNSPPGA